MKDPKGDYQGKFQMRFGVLLRRMNMRKKSVFISGYGLGGFKGDWKENED